MYIIVEFLLMRTCTDTSEITARKIPTYYNLLLDFLRSYNVFFFFDEKDSLNQHSGDQCTDYKGILRVIKPCWV